MEQIFSKNAQFIARIAVVAIVALPIALITAVWLILHSSYVTAVDAAIPQPVPFSHEHHVTVDKIDCRYCHTSVEETAFAGMPASDVCMNCHSVLFSDSEMLEPVRVSYTTGVPLQWTRVNDLPDYVYFDHSIHVNKGVGCISCHGRVDRMPLTWKAKPLYMQWCLDCHRNPAPHLRPEDEIFKFNQIATNPDALMLHYQIDTTGLTDCTTCHR